MEYIEETYCIGCGSELISTGNDSLTAEAYLHVQAAIWIIQLQ